MEPFIITLAFIFLGLLILMYMNYKQSKEIKDLQKSEGAIIDWAVSMEKTYTAQSKQVVDAFNKNAEDNRKIILEVYQQNSYNKLLLEDLCDHFEIHDLEELTEEEEMDILDLFNNNKTDNENVEDNNDVD